MAGTGFVLPTLTWTVGPGPIWEAHGEKLDYRVLAGRISTLTVRDQVDIVYLRLGYGGTALRDLLSAARAFEIVAALVEPADSR